MDELMKHPYHSSKLFPLTCLEKPGTAIFLMKERAKVYKSQKDRTKYPLAKRLNSEEEKQGDRDEDMGVSHKKKKIADGSAMIIGGS